MTGWSDAERRQNARECLGPDIDRHPLGRQLTPDARARAIEHAVDSWKGNTTAGAAAEQGIRHVTGDIIKQK